MADRNLIPISAHPKIGKITEAEYFRLYERSLADPDGFWGEQGRRLDWIKPYSKVGNASFTGDVSIRWYEDGTLNASYNCVDRHLATRGDHTAILWEGDDPGEDRRVTYRELHESGCAIEGSIVLNRGMAVKQLAYQGARYAAANPGREFAALVRYRPGRPGHEFLREYPGDVEIVRASPDGHSLLLGVNRDGWTELHLYEPSTGTDRPLPTSPHGVVANVSWAPDGSVIGMAFGVRAKMWKFTPEGKR